MNELNIPILLKFAYNYFFYWLFRMDWNNSDDQEIIQNSWQFSGGSESQGQNQQYPPHPKENKPQDKNEIPKNIEKNEETPSQIFELTEEDILCQICYKYALNAVLCSNEKCAKLFCSHCTTNIKKKSSSWEDKCPFCTISPFQFNPSPYRSAINHMELYCQLCKQKYQFDQEENHYKKSCTYFLKIDCYFCKERLLKKDVVTHTKVKHADKMDEIISYMYENPQPLLEYNKVINKYKVYLQKINKFPQIGTTGKFYCKGKLQTKCYCCNGYCGPNNGQNCLECMKLDIKRLGLPKGYLVNSVGQICSKKGQDFVCGCRINFDGSACKQGNACKPCRNMKINIKRYQELI